MDTSDIQPSMQTFQIKYACGEVTSVPTVPSQLMESFTDYLEKLSVVKTEDGGVVVIVIDGADLIKVSLKALASIALVYSTAYSKHM